MAASSIHSRPQFTSTQHPNWIMLQLGEFGAGLTQVTKELSLMWGVIGLVLYFLYGVHRSKLAKKG